eukprot:CAMPEP_0182480656 /NCGR_PEP_ID=MMETSP1319-20130603/36106_1 /TAXON_ID=172717 /ORGANISM="Bolidomonas pacifica, Strain RCC208" /LENGTH=206 /DNA_ID=CAMNT_0024682173 /DNA_START=285 /DNA_END=902 /DNA_ORIENTATION=-
MSPSSSPPSSPSRVASGRVVLPEDSYVSLLSSTIRSQYYPSLSPSSSSSDAVQRQVHGETVTSFHSKYTSDDNAHFADLHATDLRKHRECHSWAYGPEGRLLLHDGSTPSGLLRRLSENAATPLASDDFSKEAKTPKASKGRIRPHADPNVADGLCISECGVVPSSGLEAEAWRVARSSASSSSSSAMPPTAKRLPAVVPSATRFP